VHIDSLNAVKEMRIFSSLDDKQVELLCEISSIDDYAKDCVLCYEKTESIKLLFLLDGLAKSYKIDKHNNEIFLFYIEQNSMVSEVSNINEDYLFNFSNISFTEDSKVLSIDYILFKKYFLNQNVLITEFMSEIISRSNKLESLVNREFIFDSVAKVAMMIDSDLRMFNKLKRHDISLMLHIQPSTLSRVLNRLKKDAIIDIIQGKISIVDKYNLEIIYKER